MLFCIVSSGSVTNFFPTVVRTLGYNDIITLLLTAPPYVLAVFSTLLNAWHADKTGERYLHVAFPLCVAMGAYILAASTTSLAPRYLAMMLMVGQNSSDLDSLVISGTPVNSHDADLHSIFQLRRRPRMDQQHYTPPTCKTCGSLGLHQRCVEYVEYICLLYVPR